eukprot:1088961-Rhodomonas_salina.1
MVLVGVCVEGLMWLVGWCVHGRSDCVGWSDVAGWSEVVASSDVAWWVCLGCSEEEMETIRKKR